MTISAFLSSLETTSIAFAVREGERLFPWLESIHVLAIVLVVGFIAIIDLRLLGWASRDRAISRLTAALLLMTWIAFAVATITGMLMFCAKATIYGANIYFLLKMGFLLLGGCNMLYFHKITNRGAEHWDASSRATPQAAKVAGALSLLLWISVVAFGRWTGFTL
ncbi:MAG TPA: DUF6644 family protein [Burkholderiales bacterium]|nr:DUF6644 family protein [Burkholderiales bacterium]